MSKNLTAVSVKPATVVVPVATELVSAMNIEVAAQALYNYCRSLYDGKIVVAAGVTMQVDSAGAITCNGKATFAGTGATATTIVDADEIGVQALTVNTSCDIESGATLTVKSGGDFLAQSGSMSTFAGRTRGRQRVPLSNADHSVGPADGTRFELAVPTAIRIITLLSVTGQTVQSEEVLEFIMPSMVAPGGVTGSYEFRRENGTAIARMDSQGTFLGSVSAQFEFTSGAWRLWLNSGYVVADSLQYGVYTFTGVS